MTKMSFISAGFFGQSFSAPRSECQNILIHLNSSSFFFFNVKSNPIPALAGRSASYFGMEIVGSELARLQVTRGEEPAYAVKERESLPARNVQTGFQRPMVQSLHLCSMVSCETSLISYVTSSTLTLHHLQYLYHNVILTS